MGFATVTFRVDITVEVVEPFAKEGLDMRKHVEQLAENYLGFVLKDWGSLTSYSVRSGETQVHLSKKPEVPNG